MTAMDVIPAIDLLNGKCVRLVQNGPAKPPYDDDPLQAALWFAGEGALRLHLSDLNGVLEGTPRHLPVVGEIVRATGLPVQIAGGFRRIDRIQAAIDAGVDRVILGRGALESPALLEEACTRFGHAIALALEIEGDQVLTRERSAISVHLWHDVLQHAGAAGLARIIVTSLDRKDAAPDDFSWLDEIQKAWTGALVVAGGISSLDSVRALAARGRNAPEAVVVGRALHEGRFGLRQAMRSGALRAE